MSAVTQYVWDGSIWRAASSSVTVQAVPYFAAANWLWNPITANPRLDPQSRAIAAALAKNKHVANLYEFGNTLKKASEITASTPRTVFRITAPSDWGTPSIAGQSVPVPTGTRLPTGSDRHYAVADPTKNKIYGLWDTNLSSKSAGWGAMIELQGDGRERPPGTSTAAGIATYACTIRQSELAAGVIPHAIPFSSDMVRRSEFRYPATKTDGSNLANSSVTIPEGTRVQLDPSINVDGIYGITRGEKAVAKALQKYGGYCVDNGGARMAFMFEYTGSTTINTNAGLSWDYYDMSRIPWASLRVLGNWNGS